MEVIIDAITLLVSTHFKQANWKHNCAMCMAHNNVMFERPLLNSKIKAVMVTFLCAQSEDPSV